MVPAFVAEPQLTVNDSPPIILAIPPRKDARMPHYCICSVADEPPRRMWVLAESEAHARRLVSFNIEDSADAADIDKFECLVDKTHQPAYGTIYHEGGSVTRIAHR